METQEKTSQAGQIDLSKLSEHIEPKWKPGKGSKSGYQVYQPYLDARDVMNKLDEVCGRGNWQNTYDAENGVSSIAIFYNNDWVWKSDIGAEDTNEKVDKKTRIKGMASDALKRAGVVWGVGRDLYEIGEKILKTEGGVPVTSKGQKLLTIDQVSNYLNGMNQSTALLMQIVKQNLHLNEQVAYQDHIKGLLEILRKEGV